MTTEIAEPDHTLLRQISSLVAGLPTIDAIEFKQDLHTVRGSLHLASRS